MNVSFAGCGFLGLYHVGVASCFRSYAPQIPITKASGASAGAIAAVSLLAELPLCEMTSNILQVASEARKHMLGPFSPSFSINKILEKGLRRLLPDNIHTRVKHRLFISLTKVYDGSNVLVQEFNTREELIQCLLASAFIPMFSGWYPPRYRGTKVIDGGYSDNLPILDGKTITVSPFTGNTDICPQDNKAWNLLQLTVANATFELTQENMLRLTRVLLPPGPDVLAELCKVGFEDTLRFLQKRYIIACTRFLSVNSTYEIEDGEELKEGAQKRCGDVENCDDCSLHQQIAKGGTVPEHVWDVFEAAIAEAEAGTGGWYSYFPFRTIFKLVTLPAVIPLNVARHMADRLVILIPSLADDDKMRALAEKLLETLCMYLTNGSTMRTVYRPQFHHHAKYECEFTVKQYGNPEKKFHHAGNSNTADNDEESDDVELAETVLGEAHEDRGKKRENEEVEEVEDVEKENEVDEKEVEVEKKDYEEEEDESCVEKIMHRGVGDGEEESIKEMLSCEFVAHLENDTAPEMPHSQEDAIRFQNENLSIAVGSASQSRASSRPASRSTSRSASRSTSRPASRPTSRLSSRMGSRSSSVSSLCGLDGDECPDSIHLLKQVSATQEAIMVFFYAESDSQVTVKELFDVTATDPAQLVPESDPVGVNYSQEHLHFPPGLDTSFHSNSPAEGQRKRHSSTRSESSFLTKRRVNTTPLIRPASSNTFLYISNKEDISFSVGGEGDYLDDELTSPSLPSSSLESSYSDPESDWKIADDRALL